MKKVVIIFILFVYSATSLGATINLHYCMDKLVGWSLLQKDNGNECGKCGMKEKKGGCCDDKKIIASPGFDQQTDIQWVQLNKKVIDDHAIHFVSTFFTNYIVVNKGFSIKAPEHPPSIPFFIKYCTFRI